MAIAWPTTLAYLSTPLLGLIDTGVVGRLGDAAMLGGLAVGAILFDVVFTTFNFLRSSTTGLVAQALGAGDAAEQRVVVLRSLLLSVIMGFCHADRGTAGAAARSDGNGCTPGGGSSHPVLLYDSGAGRPAYLAQLLGSWMVCLGLPRPDWPCCCRPC